MKWLNKVMDKLSGTIPLDYERGFINGFSAGLKFYKDSIDRLDDAVLHSEKVKIAMLELSKKRREDGDGE